MSNCFQLFQLGDSLKKVRDEIKEKELREEAINHKLITIENELSELRTQISNLHKQLCYVIIKEEIDKKGHI